MQRENPVCVDNNSIQIKGMYGLTVDLAGVDDVVLIEESMEEIGVGRRAGGMGDGAILKGNFISKDSEENLLFVHQQTAPTIRIKRYVDKDIFLSFRDPEKTEKLYHELLESIPKTKLH